MKENRRGRAHLAGKLALVIITICSAFAGAAFAQTNTAGGTVISNQAAATYSDGLQVYNALSNTVTVTVSQVSGLAITPDAGSNPSIVPGQPNVDFIFTVANTGNFADQVRFLANGASVSLSGPATMTNAVIDVDGSNTINAGDTNIFTNGADVLSASIAQGGSIRVIVRVNVNAGATTGQTVQVLLGDAASGSPTFDNQAADSSANEVRTISTSSVNGLREARGDISAAVTTDAQLRLTLTAPAGPVALGSNINYSLQATNPGANTATALTLGNGPLGFNSGIFIIAPIPVSTTLALGQTFPLGTLYSVSPLGTDPLQAVYTVTPPADLSTVTRIAFNTGSTLASGASTSSYSFQVTVSNNANASTPISEIADAFANNSLGATITDQSGDAVANAGDGNANFNEGSQPGNVDGDGIQQQTTLSGTGAVLNGPFLNHGATGPTNNNDDYTNRSTDAGIFVAPGGTTTQQDNVVFSNTVRNAGTLNDTFILTAPTVPAGFTVEISTNAGVTYTNVTSGGSASLLVLFNLTGNYLVRVTAPAGTPVLTGFDTVIRATSTATPGASNDTIDRLYTGFVRLDKSVTITNGTGVGGASDPVPGAVITYTISYTNITSSGGSGNSTISATSIVITEDGNAAPNNWGTTTQMVVNSASDSHPGGLPAVITGGTILTSSLVVDTVANMALAPGLSGTFTFQRTIN